MPKRLDALKIWLHDILAHDALRVTPASSDASFRRYFRVESNHKGETLGRFKANSLIVMDAPPEKEDTRPFTTVSRLLTEAGLHVPQVLASNVEQGFLLLTDLGCQPYLDGLNSQTVDALYADALNALLIMQRDAPRKEGVLPPYDKALLLREMDLFREWYLQRYLNLLLSAQQQMQMDNVFQLLADSALAQPQVFVHRDYHSRNLMVTDENNPGILDFQDAVIGPVTYDLVSLLRDCYITWPRDRIEQWALDYLRDAVDAGILLPQSESNFLRWFDWMGVQRHLKATGIFARLHLRDGKDDYLKDIPRTLAYVQDVSARYPELQDLHTLLSGLPQRLLP